MKSIFAPGFEESLIHILQRQFLLDWNGTHGIQHWQRVRTNGLFLAEKNGADPRLVVLFALLHDCCRESEGFDTPHGRRAAEYLATLTPVTELLVPGELERLQYACENHSYGLMEADGLVQTCWDADRLDLGRVGYRPDANRLCTPAAREPETIEWAYRRSRMKQPGG